MNIIIYLILAFAAGSMFHDFMLRRRRKTQAEWFKIVPPSRRRPETIKLGDIDIFFVLVEGLGMERSKWINLQKEENRPLTDAELATICALHSIERTLRSVVDAHEESSGVDEETKELKLRELKLSDIDIYVLIEELGMERSGWINLQKEENRPLTDAELATICALHAIERTLRSVVDAHKAMKFRELKRQTYPSTEEPSEEPNDE
jgi:hypothetical protein